MPPFDSKDYAFVNVPKVCLDTINQNVIDWSVEQEDVQINSANYVNTTYELASNGTAGLSKYDFTLARRNKLISIETNAQVNVQSDWTSETGDSKILNKPEIVNWTQPYTIKIHENNIPNLPYVKDISFTNFKSAVDASFGKIDTSINNIKLELSNLDSSFNTFKDAVDSSFILIDSSLDNIIVDLSNLDSSFNSFKDDVDTSFGKIDLSLTQIINDISKLDFSVNNLPDFVDWTVEQTDDIHINNIPDLPYASDASLNKVILDLSNLDFSFNSFKGAVENSFNLVDSSLIDIIQDISNLDNSFSTFKLSVENSFNLVDSSLIDIIQDISTLDFSFAALSRVFDRVTVIEASLNDIIDDIDDILPDINSSNLAHVLTSTGSTAVWAPVTTLTTNDFFEPESTVVTAASTKGVFDYTQPKIINLEVSANNYIEISGADFIVNGDTSLNGILNISGEVFLNGVNIIPSISGDIVLDASRIESGHNDMYIDFGRRLNNSRMQLSASHAQNRHVEIRDDIINMRRVVNGINSSNDMYLNFDGGNVIVPNRLGVGTTSPTTQLDVNGQIRSQSMRIDTLQSYTSVPYIYMSLGDTTGVGSKIKFGAGGTTSYFYMRQNQLNVWRYSNTSDIMYLNRTGGAVRVGYQTQNLSDDRLKFNETNIENGLEVIRQLSPEKYIKKLPTQTKGIEESGFIAQEVLKIKDLSHTVLWDDNEYVEGDPNTRYYSLAYDSVFTYGIAGLKELDAIVTKQAELIQKLENRITILENS